MLNTADLLNVLTCIVIPVLFLLLCLLLTLYWSNCKRFNYLAMADNEPLLTRLQMQSSFLHARLGRLELRLGRLEKRVGVMEKMQ
jgi:hypothetical protein